MQVELRSLPETQRQSIEESVALRKVDSKERHDLV